MSEWVDIKDSAPAYGSVVLLKINGVVQSITYSRDGSDDSEDWFEPYGDHVDDELKGEYSFFIDWNSDIKWVYHSDL